MALYANGKRVCPTIKVSEGGSGLGIPRESSNQGKLQMPSSSFTYTLPSTITDMGERSLYYSLSGCAGLTSVNLPDLTTVSSSYAMGFSFSGCSNLTSVDLSSLTTISGHYALESAFYNCTSLVSLDLSSLTTVSGSYAMRNAFSSCTSLTSVDLSSLTTISNQCALDGAFYGCSNLESIDFSNLTTISSSQVFSSSLANGIFNGCTKLQEVRFPKLSTLNASQALYCMCTARFSSNGIKNVYFNALNSNSFGSYTNQFNYMLMSVSGCTVHFPSNLQSVIGSWSSVTSGFGGTNTTVLFDLPATT